VLRDAVEKIVLDVSTAQVIVLPLAAADNSAPKADHRYTHTAVFTAGLLRPAVKVGGPGRSKQARSIVFGGVAEWPKAPVLKTGDLARDP
jgi:hypothetical protein